MTYRLGIADTLRAAGLEVVEVDGWQTRGSETFNPAGVIVHHTASRGPADAPSLKVCIDGRPDLPGPLCHVLLSRSGRCYVIAAGRANHAGEGNWGGHSGNAAWFGIEAENDGVGEPWPAGQVEAFIVAARALAALSSKGLVCGHKEYAPRRKIDPTLDMDWFRAQVATPPEDDMPTAAEVARATVDLLNQEGTAPGLLGFGATVAHSVELGRQNANSLAALLSRPGSDVTAADIAAAIPEGLAQAVADELAERLKG